LGNLLHGSQFLKLFAMCPCHMSPTKHRFALFFIGKSESVVGDGVPCLISGISTPREHDACWTLLPPPDISSATDVSDGSFPPVYIWEYLATFPRLLNSS
jgi:hypothetical protein